MEEIKKLSNLGDGEKDFFKFFYGRWKLRKKIFIPTSLMYSRASNEERVWIRWRIYLFYLRKKLIREFKRELLKTWAIKSNSYKILKTKIAPAREISFGNESSGILLHRILLLRIHAWKSMPSTLGKNDKLQMDDDIHWRWRDVPFSSACRVLIGK